MRRAFVKKSLFLFSLIVILSSEALAYESERILNATVSDAPEVHGSNTTQEPYSSMWRVSGKVIGAKEEKIDDKERTYEIGGVEGSGKIDYLHKSGTLIFGAGLGYDDGLYYHLTLGWNFRDFEFGFFTGHILFRDIKYSGEKCVETEKNNVTIDGAVFWSRTVCASYEPFEKEEIKYVEDLFLGGFVGIIIGKSFLNYSFSIEGFDIVDTPILSHYISMGYRFGDFIELSLGTVLTNVGSLESGYVYGITGTVGFYLMPLFQ